MNVTAAPRPSPRGINKFEKSSRNESTLNFYAEPPHFELSLDEFEEFALARLKVRNVTLCPVNVNEMQKENYLNKIIPVMTHFVSPFPILFHSSLLILSLFIIYFIRFFARLRNSKLET
jgi:hypothetical protein